MKKQIFSFAIPLAILSVAIGFSAPTSAQAQVACPSGYTCTPIPSVPNCPAGYMCTPIAPASNACYTFSRNFGAGSAGIDVQYLTHILATQGFFNNGSTDIYDQSVVTAVTNFQEKYSADILVPNGLSHGTGYVGNATRAKLNQLCEPTQTTNSNVPNVPATDAVPISYPSPSPSPQPSASPLTSCILNTSYPIANSQASVPLTVTGTVDTSCWKSFEGNIGTAQLYFYYSNTGWSPLSSAMGVQTQGPDTWPPTTKPFSVTLNFNNGGIGLPYGTHMKVVFTNYSQKDGSVQNKYELPFIFSAPIE